MGCFTSKEKPNEEVVPDTKPKAKPIVVIPDILTEKKWVDQEIPEASQALEEERKKEATVKILGVQSKEYQYLMFEDVRCENYEGFSISQPEIIGRDEFVETALKEIKERKNIVATHAIGVGKCHTKYLKDIYFIPKEGSATVMYAKVIEEFQDGLCLFQLENYIFTTTDSHKNRGHANVEGDIADAIAKYKQINLERKPELVACYGESAKRLVWKVLTECKIESVKDMNCFFFAKKVNLESTIDQTTNKDDAELLEQ